MSTSILSSRFDRFSHLHPSPDLTCSLVHLLSSPTPQTSGPHVDILPLTSFPNPDVYVGTDSYEFYLSLLRALHFTLRTLSPWS